MQLFQPSLSKVILVGILLVSFGLMLSTSLQESGTQDELAHIPAGYGYVSQLDYRLNPEHPPLIKALAGLPLLFFGPNFPTDHSAWADELNSQWTMGSTFLYESGNNADKIIQWSRVGPILLTLLLVVLIYVWARRLVGRWWALLPATLFALSPITLSHGHYVTTDVGGALGIVLGTYFFIRFLKTPNQRMFWMAAIAFGIAQLTKFSAVLLVPFLFTLAIIWAIAEKNVSWWKNALRKIGATLGIMAVGMALLVYPMYALFTINYPVAKQVADTETILSSFADGPTPEGEICKPMRCLAELDIWMAGNKLTRPAAQYLLGVLMVIQRSAGGNTNYFLGDVSNTGSPWYFPVMYLLKEPLPMLLFVLGALIIGLRRTWQTISYYKRRIWSYFRDYITLHPDEFSMALFVVLYWAWSIQSPLNIGVRHLFPTFPFIYILSTSAWRRLGGKKWGLERFMVFLKQYSVISVLLVWLIVEVAFAYPFYLSYYNQIGGGTFGGYRFATDSNYDWGQDLKRLASWAENNNVDRIAVNYFGAGDPQYYLGEERAIDWWSARGNPVDEDIEWFAISINNLQGAIQPTDPWFNRGPEEEYPWLLEGRTVPNKMGAVPKPDARAGTSIFIYRLTSNE